MDVIIASNLFTSPAACVCFVHIVGLSGKLATYTTFMLIQKCVVAGSAHQYGKRAQYQIHHGIGQVHERIHPQARGDAGHHESHDDEEAVGFDLGILPGETGRKEPYHDASAVEVALVVDIA